MNFDSIASIVYSKKYCLSLEKTSLLFTVTIEDGAIESKTSVFKLLFYYTDHTLSTIEKKTKLQFIQKTMFHVKHLWYTIICNEMQYGKVN